MNEVYIIRRKEDGLYFRGAKKRYRQVVRTPWTPEPRKAWMSWQRDQCERLFEGHFPRGQAPEYEVVTFKLVEVKNG